MKRTRTLSGACFLSLTAVATVQPQTDPKAPALRLAVVEWRQNGPDCVDEVLMGEKLKVKNSDQVMWVIHNGCGGAILQVTLDAQKPVRFCRISPPSQQFTIDKPFTLGGGEAAVIKCEVHDMPNSNYTYKIRLWRKTTAEELPTLLLSHELDIGVN